MKKTGTFTENQKLKKKMSIKKKSRHQLRQFRRADPVIASEYFSVSSGYYCVYAAKPKGNYIILEVGTLIYYQMKNNKREQ